MNKEDMVVLQLSLDEKRIVDQSFNAVLGYPGANEHAIEKETGISMALIKKLLYMYRPVFLLMLSLRDKDAIHLEHKTFEDGHTAYWEPETESIVFEYKEKRRIVYQPRDGKKYFDSLTAMELAIHEDYALSHAMPVDMFELQCILSVVEEAYECLHGVNRNEFYNRTGAHPVEAEKLIEKLKRTNEENCSGIHVAHFSLEELRLLDELFHEIKDGVFLKNNDEKIWITKQSARAYMDQYWPVIFLMWDIQLKELLPEERKRLEDGCIVYFDETSGSSVFECGESDKQWIVCRPKSGRDYFDSLTHMNFMLDNSHKISARMEMDEFESRLLLSVAMDVFAYIHYWGSDYQPLIGAYPDEGERLIARLKKYGHGKASSAVSKDRLLQVLRNKNLDISSKNNAKDHFTMLL